MLSKSAEEKVLSQWDQIKDAFASSITGMFPISGRKNTLELVNLSYDDSKTKDADIKSQQLAKEQEKTWGVPVFAEFVLKDKETGTVINKSKQKIAVLPKMTQRFTYIIGGGEYNSAYQQRIKSGIYSKINEKGEHLTEINLNGRNNAFVKEARLKIPFDLETKKFKFNYATNNIPLYSFLKCVGVSDDEMKKEWGEDVWKANHTTKWQDDIKKMYEKKWKGRGLKVEGDSFEHLQAAVTEALSKSAVLPETTKLTIGRPVEKLSGKEILEASTHLLKTARGERAPDDQASMVFKQLLGLDDFIAEKFNSPKTGQALKLKIRNNVDRKDKISSIVSSDLFNRPLSQVFYSNALSQRPDQTNPLDILASKSLVTSMGPGGITSEHQLRPSMKMVNQTHFGVVDPIMTPESSQTGISLHLPIGVRKIGREAKVYVYDTHEKKYLYKNPAEIHGEWLGSPDYFNWKGGHPVAAKDKVMAMSPDNHDFMEVDPKKVRYIIPSSRNLFTEATNAIPFLQCNQGNRTMTGSRQPSQGVSLLNREAPLVQVKSNSKDSFEKVFGSTFSHAAPEEGKVTHTVKDDLGNTEEIHITDKTGNTHKVQIYNHFPLNEKKTFIHSEPIVKIGDTVNKGQTIADSNYTRNGVMSTGVNMHTGYVNYKSLTFEDSVVISESAAKKLSSIHMHRPTIETGPEDVVSLNKFLAYASSAGKKIKKDRLDNLDKEGVIKPGTRVKPGDILVAAVGKNELPEDFAKLGARLKGAILPYRDKSLVWDSEHEGEVVKVVKKPGETGYTVHVKTVEPMKVGDKLSARHGDKNIVGAILPDEHMPRVGGPNGKPLEMLTSPTGTPSRINLGQALELCASKIANKTGTPYITSNFQPGIDYAEKLRKELKEYGLKDKEVIYDPLLKVELENPVLTGHKYVLKLKHQVEKKESVRGMDQSLARKYSINEDPSRGGGEGAQAIAQLDMYALLAHGARANLREMTSYKAERQHNSETMADTDFWNRVMLGLPLQPPKATFAYKKFEGMLQGMGLNLKKDGYETVLTPLTDKGVLHLSAGEITNSKMLRGKDDLEIKGGLFDKKITGGATGKGWCFHPNTKVLTDKGALCISDIVNKKMKVKVLSFDFESNQFIYKSIKNYWKNYTNDTLVGIKYDTQGYVNSFFRRCRPTTLWATPNHNIFTTSGKIEAKDIAGQTGFTPTIELTNDQRQLVLGSLLGDGFMEKDSSSFNNMFKCSHGQKQYDYLIHKKTVLDNFIDSGVYKNVKEWNGTDTTTFSIRTYRHPEFKKIHEICYVNNKKTISLKWLNELTEVGLTYWYLDDGTLHKLKNRNKVFVSLSTQGFTKNCIDLIVTWFKEKWGLKANITRKSKYKNRDMGWTVYFSCKDSFKFISLVAPYVPLSMSYKVLVNPQYGKCNKCTKEIPLKFSYCNECLLKDIKNESKKSYIENKEKLVNESTIRARFGKWSQALQKANSKNIEELALEDAYRSVRESIGTKVLKRLQILTPKLQEIKIHTIDLSGNKRFSKYRTVYNIEVEDTHNYFANGLLVANCHIQLAEPFPNPLFVGTKAQPGPAVVLSGLKYEDFEKVVRGEHAITVGGKELTGGKAISEVLKRVDVNKEFEKTKNELKNLSGTTLDKANKKAKFLRALKNLNMKPDEAYIMNHLPVIPPAFRPVVPMSDGSIASADINTLYAHIIQDNAALKDKTTLQYNPELQKKLNASVYDKLKAAIGIGSVPTYEGNKELKGLAKTIAGDNPKSGFFQNKIMKRRQDLSMRSTITPAADLQLDQVAIPKDSAMELYKPFVIRTLIQSGKDLIEATKEVKEQTPMAWKALEHTIKERPVLIKRDPVLHKYNMQAYYPVLKEGKSIGLHPLACGAFNADFDGDQNLSLIVIYINKSDLDKIKRNFSEKCWYNIYGNKVELTDNFFEERRMPFINQSLPIINNEGDFYVLNMADFPRGELVHEDADKKFYSVPDGIYVISYDQYTLEAKLAKVTHTSVHSKKEVLIVNMSGKKQSFVDDDPRAVYGYDPELRIFGRWRPEESIGKLVPCIKHFEVVGGKTELRFNKDKVKRIKEVVPLNDETGYFIGCLIGDGWAASKQVVLSNIEPKVIEKYKRGMDFFIEDAHLSSHESEHRPFGVTVPVKHAHHSLNAAGFEDMVGEWIGKGAQNKRLPPFTFSSCREFRLGVLAGLLDTDGSMSISHGKAKPQFMCNMTTTSVQLALDVVSLCRSLNINVSITAAKTPKGNDCWVMTFSSGDLYLLDIPVVHPDRLKAWSYLKNGDNPRETASFVSQDIIPFHPAYRDILKRITKCKEVNDASLGVSIKNSADRRYITRQCAKTVLHALWSSFSKEELDFLDPLIKMTLQEGVTWEIVESVERTGILEEGFDITVPETETFCGADFVVRSNTMAVYLPLTEEARKEAIDRMLPSKNLFSTTNYGIMHAPDQEAVIGLHLASTWGAKKNKLYNSLQDIVNDKSLHRSDVVKYKLPGGGEKETTKGRAVLASFLPSEYPKDKLDTLLHDSSFSFKKGIIHNYLETAARLDRKKYPDVVDGWRNLGNETAYRAGFSYSIHDLKPNKELRESILKPYHEAANKVKSSSAPQEEKDQKIIEIYSKATKELEDKFTKYYREQDNNMHKMVDIKARGNFGQFRQMVIAPMLMADNKGVIPTPITKSFSEGLSVPEYWNTLYGARMGTLARASGTSVPGAMAKELSNISVSTTISTPDCGVSKGHFVDVIGHDGKEEIDITDRYLAKDLNHGNLSLKKDTLITPDLFAKIKASGVQKIEVRSPLTCKDSIGICQKCMGLNSEGHHHDIGTNIGIIASQALSEPAIQISMDSIVPSATVKIRENTYGTKKVTLFSLFEMC